MDSADRDPSDMDADSAERNGQHQQYTPDLRTALTHEMKIRGLQPDSDVESEDVESDDSDETDTLEGSIKHTLLSDGSFAVTRVGVPTSASPTTVSTRDAPVVVPSSSVADLTSVVHPNGLPPKVRKARQSSKNKSDYPQPTESSQVRQKLGALSTGPRATGSQVKRSRGPAEASSLTKRSRVRKEGASDSGGGIQSYKPIGLNDLYLSLYADVNGIGEPSVYTGPGAQFRCLLASLDDRMLAFLEEMEKLNGPSITEGQTGGKLEFTVNALNLIFDTYGDVETLKGAKDRFRQVVTEFCRGIRELDPRTMKTIKISPLDAGQVFWSVFEKVLAYLTKYRESLGDTTDQGLTGLIAKVAGLQFDYRDAIDVATAEKTFYRYIKRSDESDTLALTRYGAIVPRLAIQSGTALRFADTAPTKKKLTQPEAEEALRKALMRHPSLATRYDPSKGEAVVLVARACEKLVGDAEVRFQQKPQIVETIADFLYSRFRSTTYADHLKLLVKSTVNAAGRGRGSASFAVVAQILQERMKDMVQPATLTVPTFSDLSVLHRDWIRCFVAQVTNLIVEEVYLPEAWNEMTARYIEDTVNLADNAVSDTREAEAEAGNLIALRLAQNGTPPQSVFDLVDASLRVRPPLASDPHGPEWLPLALANELTLRIASAILVDNGYDEATKGTDEHNATGNAAGDAVIRVASAGGVLDVLPVEQGNAIDTLIKRRLGEVTAADVIRRLGNDIKPSTPLISWVQSITKTGRRAFERIILLAYHGKVSDDVSPVVSAELQKRLGEWAVELPYTPRDEMNDDVGSQDSEEATELHSPLDNNAVAGGLSLVDPVAWIQKIGDITVRDNNEDSALGRPVTKILPSPKPEQTSRRLRDAKVTEPVEIDVEFLADGISEEMHREMVARRTQSSSDYLTDRLLLIRDLAKLTDGTDTEDAATDDQVAGSRRLQLYHQAIEVARSGPYPVVNSVETRSAPQLASLGLSLMGRLLGQKITSNIDPRRLNVQLLVGQMGALLSMLYRSDRSPVQDIQQEEVCLRELATVLDSSAGALPARSDWSPSTLAPYTLSRAVYSESVQWFNHSSQTGSGLAGYYSSIDTGTLKPAADLSASDKEVVRSLSDFHMLLYIAFVESDENILFESGDDLFPHPHTQSLDVEAEASLWQDPVFGHSTLMMAALFGRARIVRSLLHGETQALNDRRLAQTDRYGFSALHYAVLGGSVAVLEQFRLVYNDATNDRFATEAIRPVPGSNLTAFTLALHTNQTEVIELLRARVGTGNWPWSKAVFQAARATGLLWPYHHRSAPSLFLRALNTSPSYAAENTDKEKAALLLAAWNKQRTTASSSLIGRVLREPWFDWLTVTDHSPLATPNGSSLAESTYSPTPALGNRPYEGVVRYARGAEVNQLKTLIWLALVGDTAQLVSTAQALERSGELYVLALADPDNGWTVPIALSLRYRPEQPPESPVSTEGVEDKAKALVGIAAKRALTGGFHSLLIHRPLGTPIPAALIAALARPLSHDDWLWLLPRKDRLLPGLGDCTIADGRSVKQWARKVFEWVATWNPNPSNFGPVQQEILASCCLHLSHGTNEISPVVNEVNLQTAEDRINGVTTDVVATIGSFDPVSVGSSTPVHNGTDQGAKALARLCMWIRAVWPALTADDTYLDPEWVQAVVDRVLVPSLRCVQAMKLYYAPVVQEAWAVYAASVVISDLASYQGDDSLYQTTGWVAHALTLLPKGNLRRLLWAGTARAYYEGAGRTQLETLPGYVLEVERTDWIPAIPGDPFRKTASSLLAARSSWLVPTIHGIEVAGRLLRSNAPVNPQAGDIALSNGSGGWRNRGDNWVISVVATARLYKVAYSSLCRPGSGDAAELRSSVSDAIRGRPDEKLVSLPWIRLDTLDDPPTEDDTARASAVRRVLEECLYDNTTVRELPVPDGMTMVGSEEQRLALKDAAPYVLRADAWAACIAVIVLGLTPRDDTEGAATGVGVALASVIAAVGILGELQRDRRVGCQAACALLPEPDAVLTKRFKSAFVTSRTTGTPDNTAFDREDHADAAGVSEIQRLGLSARQADDEGAIEASKVLWSQQAAMEAFGSSSNIFRRNNKRPAARKFKRVFRTVKECSPDLYEAVRRVLLSVYKEVNQVLRVDNAMNTSADDEAPSPVHVPSLQDSIRGMASNLARQHYIQAFALLDQPGPETDTTATQTMTDAFRHVIENALETSWEQAGLPRALELAWLAPGTSDSTTQWRARNVEAIVVARFRDLISPRAGRLPLLIEGLRPLASGVPGLQEWLDRSMSVIGNTVWLEGGQYSLTALYKEYVEPWAVGVWTGTTGDRGTLLNDVKDRLFAGHLSGLEVSDLVQTLSATAKDVTNGGAVVAAAAAINNLRPTLGEWLSADTSRQRLVQGILTKEALMGLLRAYNASQKTKANKLQLLVRIIDAWSSAQTGMFLGLPEAKTILAIIFRANAPQGTGQGSADAGDLVEQQIQAVNAAGTEEELKMVIRGSFSGGQE
jgi:hypothetical protein